MGPAPKKLLPPMTRREALALSGQAMVALAANAANVPAAAEMTSGAATGKKSGDAAINVAFLLGQHNTLIDLAGPWEILSSSAYSGGAFNVYCVAATRSPVLCDDGRGAGESHMSQMPLSGLTIVPDYTFDTAPQPRVIIIGAQTSDDATERRSIDWIRRAAGKAELTASVCTGAYLLARTGLLDGKPATTNRNAYADFEKTFPRVKLVRGVRFVDAGTIASATGLTAGVDLSLHIVERYFGRETAEAVATYEEWPGNAWRGS